ncbi:MAG TPA: tetratricopeptide repeat protein [Kiritimatiellia bacterium]|nr:tetratricopeptide repeat protein [Kiritimatiellia bacterium]
MAAFKKRSKRSWLYVCGCALLLLGLVYPQPALAQDDLGPEEMYTRSIQLFTQGRFADSIPFFSRLFAMFGNEPEYAKEMENVLYGMGSAYYNTGQFMEAVEAYTEFIKRYPQARTIDEIHFRLAAANQMQEKYDDAVATYEKLIATWPRSPFNEDASFQIAICHMAGENPENSVAAFESFAENYPKSDLYPQAMVFLARAYFQGGDYERALQNLEKAGEKTKSLDHLVYANFLAMEIGDAAFEDTEYYTALRAFRRVRTSQSMIKFQRSLVEKAEAALVESMKKQVGLADLPAHFRQERRLRASLITLKEALEKLASTADYDAALFHRIGRCFFSVDRFWEARIAYERVVNETKDAVLQETAHFDLILTLNRLRRFDDLVEAADKYLATYGKDQKLIEAERVPAVAFMRAESFVNQERFEEAETEMAALQRVYPKHNQMPRIKFYRALSIAMQERFQESIDLFKAWLKEYPNNMLGAEVAYWLPIAMFYDGQYANAIPMFDAYVEEYSMTVYAPEAAYRSALCKYSMEDFDKAAEELEAWLENYGDHIFQWEARVTLGDAYSAVGRLEEAKVAYLSAIVPEAGPMEYLALTQINKVFKALDTENDYRQMADTHIRFIQNNPNSPNMVESAYNAGWALRQIGRVDEARRLYWSTIERFGNNKMWDGFGPLLKDLRGMYRDMSAEALEKEFEGLVNKARAANRPTLVSRLAKEMLSWRDMTNAERAAELDRRFDASILDAEALAFMGNAYIRAGEIDRGRELLELLLKEFPRSKYVDVAYARKAEALLQEKKNAEALAAAEMAIEKATETTVMMEAVFTKAQALKALGKYQEAIEEFNMVLASRAAPRPLKPRAMLEAAACFEAMGDFNKAIPYYQRIYVMYAAYIEEMAQAYLRSAVAFEKIRDREAAINTYREMMAIPSLAGRPEVEEAQKMLQRLEAGS